MYSAWVDRLQEYGTQESEEANDIPGDINQSWCSDTPSPVPTASSNEGSEAEGEDSEYGNIHIVEMHKGEETLGIILTHYTLPDGA